MKEEKIEETKEATKSRNAKGIRTVEFRILVIFVLIVVCITIFLSAAIVKRSSKAIKKNASDLIAANITQLQFNINSYFDKLETTAALLFSDEAYYKYDATDDSYDEYSKIQAENAIQNRIVDLGIMENFSDFGIIYADNHNVGWISNTTKSMFDGDTLYTDVSNHIINADTVDGWFYYAGDEEGSFDRLYYVKRLNDNAVLLASFYTRELSNVFKLPKELSGMILRLTSEDGVILYSSDKNEIGQMNDITANEKSYIVNISKCKNDWLVICAVSDKIILADTNKLINFAVTCSVVLAVIFIIVGSAIFVRIVKPMGKVMNNLERQAALDRLSGLYNKLSFEDLVRNKLLNISKGECISLSIIDMDHFKAVNDTLGHAYGDEVIKRTADVLKKSFPRNFIIGRIGGDEFALFTVEKDFNQEEHMRSLSRRFEYLEKAFLKEFDKEHKSCGVSLSIGSVAVIYNNESFDEIYKKADSAMYVSKENGRNQYTFFKEVMHDEK